MTILQHNPYYSEAHHVIINIMDTEEKFFNTWVSPRSVLAIMLPVETQRVIS